MQWFVARNEIRESEIECVLIRAKERERGKIMCLYKIESAGYHEFTS